ncbi:2OG-Fe(II) oxygenase [Pseudomonas aeruginosa]|nr:2OG-Fe(II) oxygenase [Pseudomonas aeruginosa]
MPPTSPTPTNPHPRLPPDHTGNPMNTQIAQITQSLAANGCAYITPSDALYDEQDWELMNQVLANSTLPWEKILIGDADEENDLYVARFMTDRDRPTVVNHALSELIIPRVCNANVMSLFRKLMGDDAFYVRRMQVNRMKAGSFIGRHLDTDSNPDYQYSIVLQLGTYFSGGQFVVYDRDGNLRNDIKPEPRSVIISDCSYPHEVQQVTAGERVSLVFFVSRHADRNRRVY